MADIGEVPFHEFIDVVREHSRLYAALPWRLGFGYPLTTSILHDGQHAQYLDLLGRQLAAPEVPSPLLQS